MQRKKILSNFRIVATLIYELLVTIDPDLPTITHNRETLSLSFKATSSIQEESTSSWLSSFTAWLKRSGADDVDIGLEYALLNDHPIFETMRDIQRFLYVKNNFADAQSTIEPWMTPLAATLKEWIERVVRHVINVKYNDDATSGDKRDPNPSSEPTTTIVEGDESVIVGMEAV